MEVSFQEKVFLITTHSLKSMVTKMILIHGITPIVVAAVRCEMCNSSVEEE